MLRGGILANACGTGKTITVLLYLALRKRRILQEVENGSRKAEDVEPIIIFVPNTVIQEWLQDWQKNMKGELDISVFYGSKKGELHLLKDAAAIDKWYEELIGEQKKNNAGRVLITTYRTLLKRATEKFTPPDDQKPVLPTPGVNNTTLPDRTIVASDGIAASDLRLTNDAINRDETHTQKPEGNQETCDLQSGKKTKKKKTPKVILVQIHRAKFDVGIFDEGQMLKNRGSWTRLMVDKLYLKTKILVTATPMSNCPKDMYGILSLLWDKHIPFKPNEALRETKLDVRGAKVHMFDARTIFDSNFDPTNPKNRWNMTMDSMVRPIQDDNTPEEEEARKRWDEAAAKKQKWWTAHPLAFYHAFNIIDGQKDATIKIKLSDAEKKSKIGSMMKPIIDMTQTRRLMTTPLFDGTKAFCLADQIPPLEFHEILVGHGDEEVKNVYQTSMQERVKVLFRDQEEEEEKDHLFNADDPKGLDIGWIRRDVELQLKLITMDPRLADLVEIAIYPHLTQVIKELYNDISYQEMAEPSSTPKNQAIRIAEYLCSNSPKLSALAVSMASHFPGRNLHNAPHPDPAAGKVAVFATSIAARW
jgi:SNF2-related domain